MRTALKYKKEILDNFFLDEDDMTIRRKKDCVMKRFKANDIVEQYKLTGNGSVSYGGVHIPKTRTTILYPWLLVVLRGIEVKEDSVIDHKDGNVKNNARDNLRVVTQQINCKNSKKRSDNTSGRNGLTIHKQTGLFVVRRTIAGKRINRSAKTLEKALLILDDLDKMALEDGYTQRHGK